MIRVIREDIKEGKGAAHERSEAAYVRAFQKGGYPNYIAYESMTGSPHVDFVELYDSYEAIEKVVHLTEKEPLRSALIPIEAADAESRTATHTMIATLHPELSYRADSTPGAKIRFASVITLQIRPGRNLDFAETAKQRNAALEKEGSKRNYLVYAVNSGLPGGTYIVASLLDSLKALDPAPNAMKVEEMYGGPEAYARYLRLVADTFVSQETNLYSVNPKMSSPPKTYVTADADFWAPKPATPKPVAAAAKPAAKTDQK